MSMTGRAVGVLAVLLALASTRTARADEGVRLDRAKAAHLDLSLAWLQPPARSLIPPAGSSTAASTPAPPPASSSTNINGAQVGMAILFALVGDVTGVLVAGGSDSIWAGAIPWVIAPLGAAAVVCQAGGRSGRCRATLIGALIGTAVGLLPGALILASTGPKPNEEGAYHAWLQDRISGFEATFLLYAITVPTGTLIGYAVGGRADSNPGTMPPVASLPIFSLRF